MKEKKKELSEYQLSLLDKTFEKFQDFAKRSEAPRMTDALNLVFDINMYAKDNYESIKVNVERLIEIMTNFYEYECTAKIMDDVKQVNQYNTQYLSFN